MILDWNFSIFNKSATGRGVYSRFFRQDHLQRPTNIRGALQRPKNCPPLEDESTQKEGIDTSAILSLDVKCRSAGDDPRILTSTFPSSDDVRFPPLFLDSEFLLKIEHTQDLLTVLALEAKILAISNKAQSKRVSVSRGTCVSKLRCSTHNT